MHNKYLNVATVVPEVVVANPEANAQAILKECSLLENLCPPDVAVFPEMCITGYTCADLFHNRQLLEDAKSALLYIIHESKKFSTVLIVGLPIEVKNQVYNVAAVVYKGELKGLVPKTYIPNYNEFYEKRWWSSGHGVNEKIVLTDKISANLTTNQLFKVNGVTISIEICEDLWTPIPPSSYAALAGAEVIFNLSATDALVGKYDYIRRLVESHSARCIAGYVYASAGFGESSTDLVFDGVGIIASNGRILAETQRWIGKSKFVFEDIDIDAIRHDRLTMTSYADCVRNTNIPAFDIITISGNLDKNNYVYNDATPFVPEDNEKGNEALDEIINIQTTALAQRLNATGTKNIVVGISGGLDSTLALLVAVAAFDKLGLKRTGIHAITMPGFGTTGRTYHNAVDMIKVLGASFREINIKEGVRQHFKDINHPEAQLDVVYENSQARYRTMLLMDIANQVGGMVLGTGDMSELALGWATYSGDHMSMYGVNAGVPKTLVKSLVKRFAQRFTEQDNNNVTTVLYDIIDTPISPELLPADDNDNIRQITEDLVGPYKLHDFFLYYLVRYSLSPEQIFERAIYAFETEYDKKTILKWLKVFIRRFFNQQFKRSCMPDGPKVGSVSLSPRGDWRMPSDASSGAWLTAIDELEKKYGC